MEACKRETPQDNFAECIRALYILGGLQSKWENRGKTKTSVLNPTSELSQEPYALLRLKLKLTEQVISLINPALLQKHAVEVPRKIEYWNTALI